MEKLFVGNMNKERNKWEASQEVVLCSRKFNIPMRLFKGLEKESRATW